METGSTEYPHVWQGTLPKPPCSGQISWVQIPINVSTAIGQAATSLVARDVQGQSRLSATTWRPSGTFTGFYLYDGSTWTEASEAVYGDPRALVWAVGGTENHLLGNRKFQWSQSPGSSWAEMDPAGFHMGVRAIHRSSFPPGNYVFETRDGAMNDGSQANVVVWEWTPGGAPTNPVNVGHAFLNVWQAHFAVMPRTAAAEAPRLFIGAEDNASLCSDDGGATWDFRNAADKPPITPSTCADGDPDALAAVFVDPDRGYVRGCGSSNGVTNLVRTSWTAVLAPNGYTVSDVEVDPNCAKRVYAAFGYADRLTQHRRGIYVSESWGDPNTWTSITANNILENVPIADIQVDRVASQRLYAAAYGRGAWVYDLGAPPGCP